MIGNLGLNHYKRSAKDSFLPIKYYNMKIGVKPEPITLFSMSAKDFFMEMGSKKGSLLKTIQRKLTYQREHTRQIKPNDLYTEELIIEEETCPVMKPFSSKPLRTIKKKTINIKKNEQNGLFIIGNSNRKDETQEIDTNKSAQKVIKNKIRPLTAQSARENNHKNFDFTNNKNKKLGYPYELKGLVKVNEVYDLLRLGAYERIKRKEEIDNILDIPTKEVFIQRPLSSDVLLKYSKENSMRVGLEKFINKRNLNY